MKGVFYIFASLLLLVAHFESAFSAQKCVAVQDSQQSEFCGDVARVCVDEGTDPDFTRYTSDNFDTWRTSMQKGCDSYNDESSDDKSTNCKNICAKNVDWCLDDYADIVDGFSGNYDSCANSKDDFCAYTRASTDYHGQVCETDDDCGLAYCQSDCFICDSGSDCASTKWTDESPCQAFFHKRPSNSVKDDKLNAGGVMGIITFVILVVVLGFFGFRSYRHQPHERNMYSSQI